MITHFLQIKKHFFIQSNNSQIVIQVLNTFNRSIRFCEAIETSQKRAYFLTL